MAPVKSIYISGTTDPFEAMVLVSFVCRVLYAARCGAFIFFVLFIVLSLWFGGYRQAHAFRGVTALKTLSREREIWLTCFSWSDGIVNKSGKRDMVDMLFVE